jgi:hypothetical protein
MHAAAAATAAHTRATAPTAAAAHMPTATATPAAAAFTGCVSSAWEGSRSQGQRCSDGNQSSFH